MKHYVCKECGHTWQSANPSLECPVLWCRSRRTAEIPVLSISVQQVASAAHSPRARSVAFMSLNGGGLVAWLFACLMVIMKEYWLAFAAGSSALLLFVIAGIFLLMRLHRAWRAVQPAASLMKIPTPGKAVGFLFIPVFNLYWIYVALVRLMSAANALREDRRIQAANFGAETTAVYAALLQAGGVLLGVATVRPELYMVCAALVVAAGVLLFWIAHDITRIINTFR